jgi:hypothetical protein
MRDGMHDLRNVLNAVQINAFAARQLVDDATRTLACIARIEAAVQRGNGVLQNLPDGETLSSAALVLRARLHEAGNGAGQDVHVECTGDEAAPVPGLLRQAMCVVAVECQALGAQSFRLHVDGDGEAVLACDVDGLPSPGPIAMALGESRVPELRVASMRADGGWTFRWSLPPAS